MGKLYCVLEQQAIRHYCPQDTRVQHTKHIRPSIENARHTWQEFQRHTTRLYKGGKKAHARENMQIIKQITTCLKNKTLGEYHCTWLDRSSRCVKQNKKQASPPPPPRLSPSTSSMSARCMHTYVERLTGKITKTSDKTHSYIASVFVRRTIKTVRHVPTPQAKN